MLLFVSFHAAVSTSAVGENKLCVLAIWNLLIVLVLSLEPAHIMGASCTQAASLLWTYFQSRVIIVGTTPQDEYLIPNRVCLDSQISPCWDLLHTPSPQKDCHQGKLCFLIPWWICSFWKYDTCSEYKNTFRKVINFPSFLSFFYCPSDCFPPPVCVYSSDSHQPLEGAAVVWKRLMCQSSLTLSLTLTISFKHTHTHIQYNVYILL